MPVNNSVLRAHLPLLMALLLIALSAVNLQWPLLLNMANLAEALAMLLTLPARLLAGLLMPELYWDDLPRTVVDQVQGKLLWAALSVAYWLGLRRVARSPRVWLRAGWILLTLCMCGWLTYSLLNYWGCWRADTPCMYLWQ